MYLVNRKYFFHNYHVVVIMIPFHLIYKVRQKHIKFLMQLDHFVLAVFTLMTLFELNDQLNSLNKSVNM